MEKTIRVLPLNNMKHTDIIEHFSHCSICGSRVHFTYFIQPGGETVNETATCPECKISFRVEEHAIQ